MLVPDGVVKELGVSWILAQELGVLQEVQEGQQLAVSEILEELDCGHNTHSC